MSLRVSCEAVSRWLGEREPHRLRQDLQLAPAEGAPSLLDPSQGAGGEGALGVGDELVGVDLLDDAEAGARRACALRGVEREDARRELGERESAIGAGVPRGEHELLLADGGDAHHALADLERGLERVGQAVAEVGAHLETVDDHLDGVLALLVEIRRVGGVHELAVHARPHEPLPDHLLEELAVLALAPLGKRREQQEAGTGREGEDAVGHLLGGLALDRDAAVGAERLPD